MSACGWGVRTMHESSIIDEPDQDGRPPLAARHNRHAPNYEPDICIMDDVELRKMNNSAHNTKFVIDSTCNGNYRSVVGIFLYKSPFIAPIMRILTALRRTVWSLGHRAMPTRPSVRIKWEKGGIT